mmetsp:Transcript_24760/g.39318  ORF Transcript_24760/g.39318 Transcript_24760/m.39318 type:complete len:135 (+) Transcript_24760:1600-2004(+)
MCARENVLRSFPPNDEFESPNMLNEEERGCALSRDRDESMPKELNPLLLPSSKLKWRPPSGAELCLRCVFCREQQTAESEPGVYLESDLDTECAYLQCLLAILEIQDILVTEREMVVRCWKSSCKKSEVMFFPQ